MRLVVTAYAEDEQRSLDCHFCGEGDQKHHVTVLTFYDIGTHQVLVVCPEHLDMMVTVSLERHKAAMEKSNPFWYLDEDEDPWEELG